MATIGTISISSYTLENAAPLFLNLKSLTPYTYYYDIKLECNGHNYTKSKLQFTGTSYTNYSISASEFSLYDVFWNTTTLSATLYATLYTYNENLELCGSSSIQTILMRVCASKVSAGSVTLGNNCNVTWYAYDRLYSYRLTFTMGSYSHTTGSISVSSTGSSHYYTYTGYKMDIDTWAPYISDSTSGTCTVKIETYYNGTNITDTGESSGYNTATFTVTLPASVAPTVSIDVTEGNLDNPLDIFIQNVSKARVVSTPTVSYDAEIESYEVKVEDKSYSGSDITSDTLTTSGSVAISGTVTDTRGRTGSDSTTIDVVEYSSPAITEFSVVRCSASGVESDSGSHVKIVYAYSAKNLNGLNTVAMVIEHKERDEEEYTDTLLVRDAKVVDRTTFVPDMTIAVSKEHDFRISVADTFYSTSESASVGIAKCGLYMNREDRNDGGWADCDMRLQNCAEFESCLPDDLRSVLRTVTKYTDNTGEGGEGEITATEETVFLLSEFEGQGKQAYANIKEQNYQKQYDYYAYGNSRVMKKHNDMEENAIWWTRSATGESSFCGFDEGGDSSVQPSPYSYGFAPCICV